jgi:putative ABC transport system permease protein
MVAIGSGARAMIETQVASLGINQLLIFPGTTSIGGVRGGTGSLATFTENDARAITTECPTVRDCSPVVMAQARAVSGNQNWPTRVLGVYPCYLDIREWHAAAGHDFTDQDAQRGRKVCLLGQTVVENLFPNGANPLDATIRIGTIPFRVIGVLDRKGQTPWGQDQDDQILAPFSTVQRRILNIDFVQMLQCSALSPDLIYQAQDEITALMRQRHRIPPGGEDDFVIRNMLDLLQAQTASSSVMQLLLGAIASVALLVGGIGIMNIMLVSVTERTREIGVRMAVGARARDILLQFIVEALTLALFGGALGLALGIGATVVVHQVLQWPILISPLAVTASLVSAAATGVFFGLYPALKAAQLDPIEALRYE